MVPFSVKCDYVQGVCIVTGGAIKCKMPSDIASIVSTGLGVGVLAGILSGVCYVLAHGIRKGRTRKKKSEWYCEICGTFLHSTTDILIDDLVTCSKCGANVCRQKCSKFIQQTKWVCQNCLQPSETWFQGILKAIQPSSKGISGTFEPIMNPQTNLTSDLESLRKLEKEQVRDFIEKLVNVMLGENVDNASVSMLYNDRQYKHIFDCYHQELSKTLTELGSALHISISNLPITGQSPCTAHAALKQSIEKLLKVAVNLPLLERAHAHPATPSVEDTTNSSYEDLLATAIINKVISSCQNNLPSSSANSVSSKVSTSSRHKDDKEYFFGEETLDSKWKTTDLDTTSVSSLEDWMQSESSFGSRKYVDKVTLMIKQDIEEVDNFDSDNEEEDDAEYFRSSSSLLNDSDSNWFLQRRQFQGTHSPVPVPMLVPNPTSDARVLIGDKPLDDTSDLSDVGSDYEESEPLQATHSLLVQSKNIIGGKTSFEMENGDEHSESSTDSGVKEVNGKEQTSFDIPESAKTDITVDDDNVDDSSFLSIYSNTEKEAEYTEKYASLPRQILKTSTPKSSYKDVNSENIPDKPEENGESRQTNSDFEYVGNYSKKEKEKWKHAVEMKNNPYSKENIEKRIKRSNSTKSPLFGPDYYAKLAKKPSGGGKLISNEINGVSWPPAETPRSRTSSPAPELPKTGPPPIELLKTISNHSLELPDTPAPTSIHFVKTTPNRPPELPKVGPPPKESVEIDGIHQAIQAIVTPIHENNPFESQVEMIMAETKPGLYKRGHYTVETNTSELTSDSDLSYVNFYDVEHSQVFRKTKNEDIHIPITATPLGVSYKSIADENGNKNEAVNYNQATITSNAEENINVVLKETPVAKPRVLGAQSKAETGLYNKAPSAVKHRNLSSTSPTGKPALRRNLSESSLLEQSYDSPPKVLHQKRDNTLISKIYKDPKVRLFALHSREEHHGTDGEYLKPAFQSQLSLDSKVALSENSSLYLNKGRSYNSSDDGLTSEYESGKTGRMSFFSSEEDLLSLNSEEGFRNSNIVSTKNEDIKIKNNVDKSGEGFRANSPNYAITPRSTNLNKFIYGSQEDLLSIDEVEALPQRKDNTLISKIYQDAHVRNFALKTHKDFIPEFELTSPIRRKAQKALSSDDEHYQTDTKVTVQKRTIAHKKIYSSYDDLSSADISLESNLNHTINHQENVGNHSGQHVTYEDVENGYKSEDIDIEEVAKRHVVRQTLGKFSKSERNMQTKFTRSTSMDEGDGVRLSVRDLKKKFESNDTGTKPVISSLTARSLSKQVKDSLKQ